MDKIHHRAFVGVFVGGELDCQHVLPHAYHHPYFFIIGATLYFYFVGCRDDLLL